MKLWGSKHDILESVVGVLGGIVCGCIFLVVVGTVYYHRPMHYFSSKGLYCTPGKYREYGEEYDVDKNIETIELLKDETWDRLTVKERLNILRRISCIEARKLGITKEIQVKLRYMDSLQICAYYQENDSTVYISPNILATTDAKTALNCLCHEMLHAAQHQYVRNYYTFDDSEVDMTYLKNASAYFDEFEDYMTTTDGYSYEEYYSQKAECDARDYAEKEVEFYYSVMTP